MNAILRLNSSRSRLGFSLFEVLLFICMLSIMVTLALPLFASPYSAKQATHQKNAQTCCTLLTVIQAAGVPVTEQTPNIPDLLRRLRVGIVVEDGPLAGRRFQLPHLSEAEVLGAAAYLKLEGQELIYAPVPMLP